ncbi:aminoglycoside phosphotransferase family protein [Nocardioides sp. SYSU D00065]|uniref:aminoglycoside phosphotransferase family protein n=1 Tax=Nocardioides sp. SYSU D00065 TaxID=2817378 RepID=UPI001B341321|nr:aminoglycoside phosphotransferase family protein [Nocardioides sp. SYSU D00065]
MERASASSGVQVPDLGPPPERITVDLEIVRHLVARQFPQWSNLTVEPVDDPGWDNYTFRLGDDLSVRMPSAAQYALAVEKERQWLPRLAPRLPVPVPTVRGRGVPGSGYPFPWSIYDWLDGSTATTSGVADQLLLAEQLADFILSLRDIEAADGPQPGIHNWYRGATLLTYDATARRALGALTDHIDVGRALDVWAAALAAPWDGVDAWFHGDLAAGNLLLRDGQLAGVIDFGTCGVGDPSCDLAVAWTLLAEPGRQVLKDRLRVDDASWARGRGWALWKTLSGLASAVADDDAPAADRLMHVYREIEEDGAGDA